MVHFLIKQHRAITIFFGLVFVFGFLALSKLGREELPEFPGEGLNITAVLPGASPSEMDLKVGRLLNQAIVDISGVNEVITVAREGFIHLSVEFMQDEKDLDSLRREITQVISQVPNLPKNIEGPYVSRQLARLFPAITLLFKGGTSLQRHIEWNEIEQTLMSLASVDEVEPLGNRSKRVEVKVDPMKLQSVNIRIDQLSHKIKNALVDSGSGKQHGKFDASRVRTHQKLTDLAQLENITINLKNVQYPVSYFAEVEDVLSPELVRVVHEGREGFYINVYRRRGSNIGDLAKHVRAIVSHSNSSFENKQQDFKLQIIYDRSEVVTKSLSQLTESILFGMGIVFIILWLFLGQRNAFYASIGIPFSFFAAFIVMDLMGLSINTLTLFGLVLVSGMVVDDAIVVLENVNRKKLEGLESLEAIVVGLKEVAPAVLAATGTSVAVFLPLMLMSGGMGQFLSLIPKVAIIALVASLVECFIILPVHLFSPNGLAPEKNFLIQINFRNWLDSFGEWIVRLCQRLLLRPYWSLLIFFLLIMITGGIAYLRLDFNMFNSSDVRVIRFHFEFDKTIDLNSNEKLLEHAVNQIIDKEDYFENIILLAGYSNYDYRVTQKENVASIELILNQQVLQNGTAIEVADKIEPFFASLPGLVYLQRSLQTNAPPIGTPVKIFLYGENSNALKETTQRVRNALKSISSITRISDPMEDGVGEFLLSINSDIIGANNIQASNVGYSLRTAISGVKVGKMERHNDIVDLIVIADLKHSPFQMVTDTNGNPIPRSDLGTLTRQTSPEKIKRVQGKRYITINAEVDRSILSAYQTHRSIEKLVNQSILSAGVTFEQKGEFGEAEKSLASMLQSGLIGLGLAYFILTLLFRSLLQPMIVFLAIPLSYMGVIWGMTLTNQTLSMMGFVGIIGLMGIVINDSLLWVSFYNQLKSTHSSVMEAAVQAVRLRYRPILLTTFTTVGGMLPVSLSQSAGIANAMATTIVYGLTVASFCLLLFLPIVVVVIDDLKRRMNIYFKFLRPSKYERPMEPIE